MYFIKHVRLFININLVQLRRKWLSLPLLFLFPPLLLSMITIILISLVPTADEEPIEIGLVDQDESKETRFIVEFITENKQLGSFMNVHHEEWKSTRLNSSHVSNSLAIFYMK